MPEATEVISNELWGVARSIHRQIDRVACERWEYCATCLMIARAINAEVVTARRDVLSMAAESAQRQSGVLGTVTTMDAVAKWLRALAASP